MRAAASSLDRSHRLGVEEQPRFLTLGMGAPPAWRLSYLGLTSASERWLARTAGEDFAWARRRELSDCLRRGGVDPLPQEPMSQIVAAVGVVARAASGAPLTLAAMPLGFGDGSGSGLAYSCDPATGRPGLSGVFRFGCTGSDLLDKGGEDLPAVVASEPWGARLDAAVLAAQQRQGRPVRVEFVVERGQLWVLAVSPARLGGAALVRAVGTLGRRGRLSGRQALSAVDEDAVAEALSPAAEVRGLPVAARGLGVSPGTASGVAVFSPADAVIAKDDGRPPVLVLRESRPGDLPGLLAAAAIVTERGGRTSHAGVVARSLGRPCIAALSDAAVDTAGRRLRLSDGRSIAAGEKITVDGRAGVLYRGSGQDARPARPPETDAALRWLLRRADEVECLAVRVNADTAADAIRGRDAGAQGVGLCRIEHLFLDERQALLERALLTSRGPEAAETLEVLEETLRVDLEAILRCMDGLPVTVRLLDPPRHEFLPDVTELAVRAAVAEARGEPADAGRLASVRRLREHNPMLGVRGVRLGILVPELAAAQLRALVRAVLVLRRAGRDPRPELLIPMVSAASEVDAVRGLLVEVCEAMGVPEEATAIPLGVMIETPRAALLARPLAARADFFSIGTNDLTSLVWGLSREDAELELMPSYVELGVVAGSPFERFDTDGVGALLGRAVADAREAKPGLPIGVCGEHAAEAAAVRELSRLGIDYLSCVAPQVPVARLASARAALGLVAPRHEVRR